MGRSLLPWREDCWKESARFLRQARHTAQFSFLRERRYPNRRSTGTKARERHHRRRERRACFFALKLPVVGAVILVQLLLGSWRETRASLRRGWMTICDELLHGAGGVRTPMNWVDQSVTRFQKPSMESGGERVVKRATQQGDGGRMWAGVGCGNPNIRFGGWGGSEQGRSSRRQAAVDGASAVRDRLLLVGCHSCWFLCMFVVVIIISSSALVVRGAGLHGGPLQAGPPDSRTGRGLRPQADLWSRFELPGRQRRTSTRPRVRRGRARSGLGAQAQSIRRPASGRAREAVDASLPSCCEVVPTMASDRLTQLDRELEEQARVPI